MYHKTQGSPRRQAVINEACTGTGTCSLARCSLASSLIALYCPAQSLHPWDGKLNDLWLECFTQPHPQSPTQPTAPPQPASAGGKTRRPCTYCGNLYHYPDNCPSILFTPFVPQLLFLDPPRIQHPQLVHPPISPGSRLGPNSSPPTPAPTTSPSHIAATLTEAPANASPAGFAMPAPSAAAPPTGRGTAQTPDSSVN